MKLDKFWDYVDKTPGQGPTLDCWLWTRGRITSGYGNIYPSGGKQDYAHRVAYFLATGIKPPKGMDICHKCDNPPCVNPDHLYAGSRQDNVNDMKAKGRSAKGDRNGSRKHPERFRRGERHGMAILTEKTARWILKMYPTMSISSIAKVIKRPYITVYQVVRHINWAHLRPS
jgi:hypothetical protein